MKKLYVVLIAVVMVLTATVAMAGISTSKHDLADPLQYTGALLSACQYCHTPHHAVIAGTAPLWNRTISAGYTSAGGAGTYQVYGALNPGVTGSTLSTTTVNQPGSNSKTCLSCHDGTLAIGSVINGTGGTVTDLGANVDATGLIVSTATNIGTDLRDDHPVGVVYNTAASKAGLNATLSNNAGDPTRLVAGKNWTIYGDGAGGNTVECGSCHDPHNTTPGQQPFLKDALATMCTDCHSAK